jgi:acetolactate synthase I/II/III large subunit
MMRRSHAAGLKAIPNDSGPFSKPRITRLPAKPAQRWRPVPSLQEVCRPEVDGSRKVINGSHRAVMLLGLLASKPTNAEAVRAFMRKTGIPTVGTFQAAGTVSADLFHNFAGRIGQLDNSPGDELLATADVIITVGYDPVEYDPSIWNRPRAAKLIPIDSNRADIDNFYVPAVEVLGDVAASLFALLDLVGPIVPAPDVKQFFAALSSERALRIEKANQHTGDPIHPLRIVAELQKWLTQDVTLCVDMGSFHLWIAHFLFSFRARQILISNGQQTLGVALPWGIASLPRAAS